jgi:hypothetical protein
MSDVKVTLILPEELVNDAQELALLTSESIAELLQAEIERRRSEAEDEAAWEEAVLSQALGDALRSDGSIDFDKLDARGLNLTLEELHPEGDADDKP